MPSVPAAAEMKDELNQNNASVYEKPLYLPGMKYPIFPDFTILDLRALEEVYWEHLGRMADPDL